MQENDGWTIPHARPAVAFFDAMLLGLSAGSLFAMGWLAQPVHARKRSVAIWQAIGNDMIAAMRTYDRAGA